MLKLQTICKVCTVIYRVFKWAPSLTRSRQYWLVLNTGQGFYFNSFLFNWLHPFLFWKDYILVDSLHCFLASFLCSFCLWCVCSNEFCTAGSILIPFRLLDLTIFYFEDYLHRFSTQFFLVVLWKECRVVFGALVRVLMRASWSAFRERKFLVGAYESHHVLGFQLQLFM